MLAVTVGHPYLSTQSLYVSYRQHLCFSLLEINENQRSLEGALFLFSEFVLRRFY